MAARTPAYKKEFKLGAGRIIVYHFTEVDDGDTWASGYGNLTTSPMFATAWLGNPATQTSAGGHIAYSSGTVTFYPSTDDLGCDLTVYS
jgi:hypothetical protein